MSKHSYIIFISLKRLEPKLTDKILINNYVSEKVKDNNYMQHNLIFSLITRIYE